MDNVLLFGSSSIEKHYILTKFVFSQSTADFDSVVTKVANQDSGFIQMDQSESLWT
jgi:hypothetical protein